MGPLLSVPIVGFVQSQNRTEPGSTGASSRRLGRPSKFSVVHEPCREQCWALVRAYRVWRAMIKQRRAPSGERRLQSTLSTLSSTASPGSKPPRLGGVTSTEDAAVAATEDAAVADMQHTQPQCRCRHQTVICHCRHHHICGLNRLNRHIQAAQCL